MITGGKGFLATSRAFGDFSFKPASSGADIKMEDVVISVPEIREIHLDFVTDDFILIGSDGIFDSLGNQEITDFVNERLSNMYIGSQDAQKVAEELIAHAYKANISRDFKESDNLSVIIVPLTRGILKPSSRDGKD